MSHAMRNNPEYEKLLTALQQFVRKPRLCWILTPRPVEERLSLSESKLGGFPYPGELDRWPECPQCRVPLHFIIQLNRRRFPQMWFPRQKSLFQLFRCPNHYCDWNNMRFADRYMLAVFCRTRPGRISPLERPDAECEDEHIEDHKLTVQKFQDYPTSYEGMELWWGDRWVRFHKMFSSRFDYEELHESGFWDFIPNHEGIKIAGLPSWQQAGYPPTCRCGRIKEFVFQLASLDALGIEILIGDAGNIYYFICRRCGEESLESRWDCG